MIDIRTLVPLDEDTIFNSIAKTNHLIVVNEAPMTCGFAGEIIARVAEKAFELLGCASHAYHPIGHAGSVGKAVGALRFAERGKAGRGSVEDRQVLKPVTVASDG